MERRERGHDGGTKLLKTRRGIAGSVERCGIMTRMSSERVLVIGDSRHEVQSALASAMPAAQVTSVESWFDGIAELAAQEYTAVLAAVEPIERRPEPAVKTLRELAGGARLVLFGHPTLEPLSRKMLDFGCDDYMVSNASGAEVAQVLSAPLMRVTPAVKAVEAALEPAEAPGHALRLAELPLAEILLEAVHEQPHNAPGAAIARLNEQLGPTMQLAYVAKDEAQAAPPEGRIAVSHAVRNGRDEYGQLQLILPRDEDANAARHFLSRLAALMGRIQDLQDRHTRLQKLAVTDELTGLYNARYFRHFLSRILDRARAKLFPVTLLIFDIDDFKKYNDRYGHGVGDEILKQTAELMKRCCREHDLVARLGGDEFAVVFWEKEGPRQPKEPQAGNTLRPPQTPEQVMERFKRLLAKQEFRGLGPGGQGTLTISGGVAVFPYHANTMEELIALADRRLVFGAKQAGKNRIFLVGGGDEDQKAGPKT